MSAWVERPHLQQQKLGVGGASRRAALGPVGWLLGPDLLGKVFKILRKRSDPRDWMPYYRGAVHDECWQRDGSVVRINGAGGLELGEGQVIETPVAAQGAERVVSLDEAADGQHGDVWFDYVSDMGDASEAMYAVAYASMIAFDGVDAALSTTWSPQHQAELLTPGAPLSAALPRSQFLFVGGDTAYHVSDAVTLRNRVQRPFQWAFADASVRGHVPSGISEKDRTRRIYGIPGNHDWYDNLKGFSLVFRLGSASPKRAAPGVDPIDLPDLERVQLASYVAIQLPYGWQLWGLDIDTPLDARQQAYFESLGGPPERLILATPSPALAFGAAVPHASHVAATESLGLRLPRVPLAPGAGAQPTYRLDLSGDIHHYARYYPRAGNEHYGSVVAGLGGAFHHPSFSRATGSPQRLEPVKLFPSEQDSRRSVADQLLSTKSAWYGSWARVFPLVITIILGFAATRSGGGAWLLDQLLGRLPGIETAPTVGGGAELLRSMGAFAVFLLAVAGVVIGALLGRMAFRTQMNDPRRAQSLRDLLFRPGWVRRIFDVHRSYWLAWLCTFALTTPFLLYPLWGWQAQSPRLDIATAVIVLLLPLAGAYVAAAFGAKHLRPAQKTAVAAVGFVHAAAQVATAVIYARLVPVSGIAVASAGVAFLLAAAGLRPARVLFKGGKWWHSLLLAALAAAVLVASLGVVVAASGGHYVQRQAWHWETLRLVLAGVLAMPLGTTWLIWYLAVAGVLNAHNNEVGGAARVTEFRQLIRFRVHRGGLTGFVISIESHGKQLALHQRGANLVFKLIDVFTIATPAASTVRSSATDELEKRSC